MLIRDLSRASFLFAVGALAAVAIMAGCTGTPEGCASDADCDGQLCIVDTGACVDCLSASDCEDGGGCCNGACIAPAMFENSCGCETIPGGGQGSACSASEPICTANALRVDGAGLASGSCQSPCQPQFGGTISAVDNTTAQGFACTCDGGNDLGTCNVPFLRDDGLPHRGSDLCDPTDKCTCFNGPIGNDGCSALTPDCDANAGCVNLHDDDANCGLPRHDCAEAENGPDDASGVCLHAGCTCDQASDCTALDANTDSCQFVGNGSATQCVCDDYSEDGETSACPLQLACVEGGCQLEGQIYSTLVDILDALNLDGMSLVVGADGGG